MLILSDLIDEIKEKNDSPEQGLNELEASVTQQELQFSPHMEYISRHVYHSLSKENDTKTEKRVSFLYLLILNLQICLYILFFKSHLQMKPFKFKFLLD